MVSIIIPAREEKYLQRTIDIISKRCSGEIDIEIIVILDGYWPSPALRKDNRVKIIHIGEPNGIRANVQSAIRVASGKHILKLDSHCSISKGFDKILVEQTEENWISVPSRYSLDEVKWKKTRGPVDYMMLTYPYENDKVYGWGFHGKKWRGQKGDDGSFWHLEKERKDVKIDDIIIFQGSCWFMHKSHFEKIGGYSKEHPYIMFQEAPELSFKTWLSGGRVVRNKNVWFAHLHKTKENSANYGLSKKKKYEVEDWSADYWMNNKWPGQVHKFEWLIDKFQPMAGWENVDWNQKFRMKRG